jgi:hypothetical protein
MVVHVLWLLSIASTTTNRKTAVARLLIGCFSLSRSRRAEEEEGERDL